MKKVMLHLEFMLDDDNNWVSMMTEQDMISAITTLMEHERRGLAQPGSTRVIQLQVEEVSQ